MSKLSFTVMIAYIVTLQMLKLFLEILRKIFYYRNALQLFIQSDTANIKIIYRNTLIIILLYKYIRIHY